jgi:uncharacterized membrane protein HdeD (DUF308 family)
LEHALARTWWVYGLRGIVAISLGVLALMWPGITQLGLVGMFAVYALVTGVVSVAGAIKQRPTSTEWCPVLLTGFVGIGAGVLAIDHPSVTMLALVLLMGLNAVATGFLDIAHARELRRATRSEWLIVLSGLVSIAFGVLVMLFPSAGALAMVWLVAGYAILTGMFFLSFAARAWVRARKLLARKAPAAGPRHGLQT